MIFGPGMGHFPEETVPNLKNRSHRILARVEVGHQPPQGVIVHQGGRFAGWSLYCDEGRLTYAYNYYALALHLVRADAALIPGAHDLVSEFDYEGPDLGGRVAVTLSVDGDVVARDHLPRTVAYSFSYHETLDIGVDPGTPIASYPWDDTHFTGRIHGVKLELLEPPSMKPDEARGRRQRTLKRAMTQTSTSLACW